MLQSVSAHVQLSVTLSHEFIVLSAHAFAVGLLFSGSVPPSTFTLRGHHALLLSLSFISYLQLAVHVNHELGVKLILPLSTVNVQPIWSEICQVKVGFHLSSVLF